MLTRRGAWVRTVEFLARTGLQAAFDFRVEGLHHIPPTGGMILASTHRSHLDPIAVRCAVDRMLGFVARKTLFANRIFGAIIRSLGAIELDRDAATPAGLREIVEILAGGAGLVFFPEGTRSPDGRMGPLRPGIALLARRTGVPVVPTAVEGTFECWPRHRKLPRRGRIRVLYGAPVVYGESSSREEILGDLDERLRDLESMARLLA